MATVTPTITKVTDGGTEDVYIVQWTPMGNADTGVAVRMAGGSDRSVQIEGTFGAATVVIQGSNDGSNWETLSDPQGSAISKTSASLKAITELTRQVRPVTSGGSGTALTVTLLIRGQR